MSKFSKSFVLTLFILFIVAIAGYVAFSELTGPVADVYIENNTVTTKVNSVFVSTDLLEEDICNYVLEELNDYDSDVDSVKQRIKDLGSYYGIDNLRVNLNSECGHDKLSTVFNVEGTSMVPTLQDGQDITVEKTKDIHVNDIVVANSPQYGVIVKRVNQIDNDEVYLTSDNKKVSYEEINGILYETKGITTWVDISDIYGIVRSY